MDGSSGYVCQEAKEWTQAVYWYERAAKQNYPPAFVNLGLCSGEQGSAGQRRAAQAAQGSAAQGGAVPYGSAVQCSAVICSRDGRFMFLAW